MVPDNTHNKIGPATMTTLSRRFPPDKYYAISGRQLTELLILANRFTYSFDNPGENRDWQNLINLWISDIADLELPDE